MEIGVGRTQSVGDHLREAFSTMTMQHWLIKTIPTLTVLLSNLVTLAENNWVVDDHRYLENYLVTYESTNSILNISRLVSTSSITLVNHLSSSFEDQFTNIVGRSQLEIAKAIKSFFSALFFISHLSSKLLVSAQIKLRESRSMIAKNMKFLSTKLLITHPTWRSVYHLTPKISQVLCHTWLRGFHQPRKTPCQQRHFNHNI